MGSESDEKAGLDPRIAYGAGYLLGVLIRHGLQAVPVIDEDGYYTDEITVTVPNPDHHYPDMNCRVRVEGWESPWWEDDT